MPAPGVRRLLRDASRHRARIRRRARRALALSHRTIVVLLLEPAESPAALDLACRLAADRGAHLLVLASLFVEAELPLDAHFVAEEATLCEELGRSRAVAESYGIGARGRIVRTRHGQLGTAVADAADECRATLIVLGARIDSQLGFRRPFSRDVWSVLRDAPCRVMVAAGGGSGTSRAAA